MALSPGLRAFRQLSVDSFASSQIRPRCLFAPHMAAFSTSASYLKDLSPKKQKSKPIPKRGIKTLKIKRKGVQASTKPPGVGERKAQRKRVVLTNDNALEVAGLHDLSRDNVFDADIEGRMLGLPNEVVDALRAVDAFKPKQGWNLFRRPATLMRKQTTELARLLEEVESSGAGKRGKTVRRIVSGDRMSGKSTLLLQALAMALIRNWVVINLPEAKDITNAHTDYAPVPGSQPPQYFQHTYTANLLNQILKANSAFLDSAEVTLKHNLPLALPANSSLRQLVQLGALNPEASWPIFAALWQELGQPGRPPIMLAVDSLPHIMRDSEYLSPDMKPIHAHALVLVSHFMDHLSGKKELPNGGMVVAALSASNKPSTPALDHCIEVARAIQADSENVPVWNPYKGADTRVMDALKDLRDPKAAGLDIIHVGGLSKEEARAIMEYYAESGMLRARVDDGFVAEKWSLAGMGNIGELERVSVRLRV